MTQREAILAHAKQHFQAEPDYPFEQFPDYAVLRHADNEKWFALLMLVPRSKLGLEGSGDVEVIDLKVAPEKLADLLTRDGFLPAYHMNKEHWLTVVLGSAVPTAQIYALLDESYQLTK